MKLKKGKSFDKKKAAIAALWKTAKEQVAETPSLFALVDKGRYLAKLIEAKCTEIGERAWKNFAMTFEIQEGDFTGTNIVHRAGLETEENLTFLIRDFQKLGVDIDDLEIESNEQLDELGAELVKQGLVCRIVATEPNDKGFQNYYINKVMEAESSDAETDDTADSDDLVGQEMAYRKGKKLFVGKILSIDKDDETFVMKTEDKKKISGSLDDLEALEDDNDDASGKEKEVEVEVGSHVVIEYKGKDVDAVIKEIDEENEQFTVFLTKLKKKIVVDASEVKAPF